VICKPCGKAADLAVRWAVFIPHTETAAEHVCFPSPQIAAAWSREMAALHDAFCDGPTRCDCQHRQATHG